MQRKKLIYIAKCATILSAVPIVIYAYASGPPAKHTGAPGDLGTCAMAGCHVGTQAVQGATVQITYSGGTTYVPGERGKFTVTITDTNARRAYGFQASARLSSNNSQAGTLHAGAGQQIICENDRMQTPCPATAPLEYIEHNRPNTAPQFEFEWTPPSAGAGEVTVYVAANAANGDGTNNGDRIYNSSIKLTPAASGPVNRPSVAETGVADAFNFQRGLAENAWIALFGTNLSTETRTWDGSVELTRGELPMTLGGVSVTIGGKPAAVYAVSPTQVNVLAPLDSNLGNVPVVLKNANGESTPVTAVKVALLPGFYAPFAQEGRLFVTGVENATGALLGKPGVDPRATRAFRPGDVVQFYANGLGPTNPAVPANQFIRTPAPPVNAPTIRINDVPVEVLGAVLVNSGLFQVNARIPELPNGDHPIVIEVASTRSASNVSITIQR